MGFALGATFFINLIVLPGNEFESAGIEHVLCHFVTNACKENATFLNQSSSLRFIAILKQCSLFLVQHTEQLPVNTHINTRKDRALICCSKI